MTEHTHTEGSATAVPFGEFRIGRTEQDGAIIVEVAGDVDTTTAPALVQAADTALAEQPPVLVVDLSRVEFLASPGLTALLTIHRNARPGTAVRIVASGRATLRPIQLTGLEESLSLFPTREAALTGS
ncbi:anti-sigma factor antagonist [Amycolatopsis balhimycina DSM 5908]|uniref:Anti-sigma factor antagonist n=1 Tax=Amycolatopsis balhimycina DSM 5908 TaxID=1081091 RepID=A0A428WC63_AMYBA|nr:STAS domain-containing protein [Amycolatopsis balhimycina]RSM40715.1 anti-sigma factor antagonist [Amycolatopsis balhimycina DSM 5908]